MIRQHSKIPEAFMGYTLKLAGSSCGSPMNKVFIWLWKLFTEMSFLLNYYCKATNATYHSLVPFSLLFKAPKETDGKAEAYVKTEHFILFCAYDFSIRKLEKHNITCKNLQPALRLYFVACIFIHVT